MQCDVIKNKGGTPNDMVLQRFENTRSIGSSRRVIDCESEHIWYWRKGHRSKERAIQEFVAKGLLHC